MKVDNAIIMAAGTSSRFAPLSYERHKGLTVVHGEVLIERQVRQLHEAGVDDVYVITGYKAEQFSYLTSEFGVSLIHNPSYLERNNNSSIWAARDVLANSFLCSADNYFSSNPFEADVSDAYYAAEYAEGETAEWCMEEDTEGYISSVTVGGSHAWYMLGHTFWSAEYSKEFLRILGEEYDLPQTADKLWESIFMEHLDTLKMRIRKYEPEVIHEFDTLDELREFDSSYVDDTRSSIVGAVARELGVTQREIVGAAPLKGSTTEAEGFTFLCAGKRYAYGYESGELTMVGE